MATVRSEYARTLANICNDLDALLTKIEEDGLMGDDVVWKDYPEYFPSFAEAIYSLREWGGSIESKDRDYKKCSVCENLESPTMQVACVGTIDGKARYLCQECVSEVSRCMSIK